MKILTIALIILSTPSFSGTFDVAPRSRTAHPHLLQIIPSAISTAFAAWNYVHPPAGKGIRELLFELVEARGELRNNEHVEALEAELQELSEKDPRKNVAEPIESEKQSYSIGASQTSIKPQSNQKLGFVPGMLMAPANDGKSSGSTSNSEDSGEASVESNGASISEEEEEEEEFAALLRRRPRSSSPQKTHCKKRKRNQVCNNSSDSDSCAEINDFIKKELALPGPPEANVAALYASCSTPIPMPTKVLSPREKFQDAVRTVIAITKNMERMKARGIKGKMLQENCWPEARGPNHPFVSGPQGVEAQMDWEKSGCAHSFHKALNKLPSVDYLTYAERNNKRVDIQDGRLTQNGKPLILKTLIFVIGPYGELYAGPNQTGKFHHSSFLAGGAVLWAGELDTNENGEIVFLSNDSGHYQPGREQTLNGLRELERRGIDLSKAKFEECSREHDSPNAKNENAKEYLQRFSSDLSTP